MKSVFAEPPAPIVLIDMDGVIARFDTSVHRHLTEDLGYDVDIKDINIEGVKRLAKTMPDITQDVIDWYTRPGFFLNLEVMPGAKEGIKHLQDNGLEVFILTAPLWQAHSRSEKAEWLYKHFPKIPYRNIIMASKKHLVCGDYFIDDHEYNLYPWRDFQTELGRKVIPIAYPHPFNKDTSFVRLPWGQLEHFIVETEKIRNR